MNKFEEMLNFSAADSCKGDLSVVMASLLDDDNNTIEKQSCFISPKGLLVTLKSYKHELVFLTIYTNGGFFYIACCDELIENLEKEYGNDKI